MTLISSTHICIDFKDHVIYGYLSLSKVPSIMSIHIIPHEFTSVYRVLLQALRKAIESFVKIFSSVANQPYYLPPFLIDTVILFIARKVKH